ncbi:hypothetical protein RF11_16459 [Thelohanellus kitauei]|uniref:Uncharacterized protein n=1 Tax=Thelohanellus kitauei TaxID=669202 RepID=A0A0C2J6T1_THEKT|nr:hypothetical protein RF11_16459 [Thelohanellus kitauei]
MSYDITVKKSGRSQANESMMNAVGHLFINICMSKLSKPTNKDKFLKRKADENLQDYDHANKNVRKRNSENTNRNIYNSASLHSFHNIYTCPRYACALVDSLLEVFACETKAIIYLFDNRVFQEEKKCSRIRKFMQFQISKKSWKCGTRSYRKESSIFKKTFFGTSRVPWRPRVSHPKLYPTGSSWFDNCLATQSISTIR